MNVKKLLVSLGVSLGVGVASWLFTSNSMNVYKELNTPPLAPPGWIFPIVWTILFILMGISAYLVWRSKGANVRVALIIYLIQLMLNFIWTLVFFNLGNYLAAFFILIALWFAIIFMLASFKKITALGAYLQIPYLLWVTFAGYLNLSIYFMNKAM